MILLILTFTISASFASENVTDVEAADENVIEQDDLEETEISEGNFTELQSYIDSKDDDVIYLERNYTYDGDKQVYGRGVVINKSVTIDGKGHTLNGNNTTRIFQITHSGVVLKNITFAYGKTGGDGCAVYASCNNITIIDCRFIDNHVSGNKGGAVYLGGANNTISNSYFKSLESCDYIEGASWQSSSILIHGPTYGAAVYFAKGGNIVAHSIFEHNNAVERGGALYFAEENNLVEYSTFLNNTAYKSGFAIEFAGSNNRVVNSRFEDNRLLRFVGDGNGVIMMGDNNTIIGCNFTGNSNSDIEANCQNNIADCLFEYSKYVDRHYNGLSSPGAVTINSNNNVTGCTFKNNRGDWKLSGAIQAQNNNRICDCNFTGNSGGIGGAIAAETDNTISGCIFEDNEGRSKAGAIYLNTKNNVSDCTFINNTAEYEGGAVYMYMNDTIADCRFNNNSASRGGAVYAYKNDNILKSNFTQNRVVAIENPTYDAFGGAIYIDQGYTCLDELNFIANEAIPFIYSPSGHVKFTRSQINETHYSINIYFDGKNIELFSAEFYDVSDFSNCNLTYYAMFDWDDNYTCTYMEYSEIYYQNGSYVEFDMTGKNITVVNQTFIFPLSYQPVINVWAEGEDGDDYYQINDVSQEYSYNRAHGGAIACNNPENDVVFDCHISNSNFTDNTASDYGGAIYYYAVEWSNITNCNFNNNSAYRGGAIYLSDNNIVYDPNDNEFDGEIYIMDSNFDSDQANATITFNPVMSDSDLVFQFRGEDKYLNAVYSNFIITFKNSDIFGDDDYHSTNDTGSRIILSNDKQQNLTIEIYDSDMNLLKNFTQLTDELGYVRINCLDVLDAIRYVKCYRMADKHFRYAEAFGEVNLGDFTILQILVNSLNDGETLNLTRNYTYTIGLDDNITEGVVINRTGITVNANGYTINALNKSRIFDVASDDVSFENVVFLDGKYCQDGAVRANDACVISAEGCKFINSGVGFNGASLTFENCEFSQNTSVSANAATINVLGSQFHNLYVADNAVLINASDVLISGCEFENNIAYNLSGDTLYTGGFASLININATDALFKDSRFKNNTLRYLIYSLNTTGLSIDNLNISECDFSAYKIKNGIIRDVEGNGTVIGGNYTNLEIRNSKFDNIKASRYSFLFDLDVKANLTIENSEFTNLNCPYGVMSVEERGLYAYNSSSYSYYLLYNFTESSIVFDHVLFKNIASDYNMTFFDWDDVHNRYIWDYSRGKAHGLDIYGSSKNVTLSNACFDDVNGGFNNYINIYSQNLNLTNFTVANSKIGADYIHGYHHIFSCAPHFVEATAYGNLTLEDISLDSNSVLDFNHTSYNSTLDKYLTTEYYSLDGGVGMYILSYGDAKIYNVNVTNSIVPQDGFLSVSSNGNITFEEVSVINITQANELILDKYYEDLDLQTYESSTDSYSCMVLTVSGANVEFRNVLLDNVYSTGYYSPISVGAWDNLLVENVTCINSNFGSEYNIECSAENGTVRNIVITNLTSHGNKNVSKYDYELGRYIWDFENRCWNSPGLYASGSNFCMYNINITDSIKNSETVMRVDGGNITMHDIYINNITKSKFLEIKWDKQLGRYLNKSYYEFGYEGGIAVQGDFINMTNIVLSNIVNNEAEMFEVWGYSANLENITLSNFIPGDYEWYEFDKDLGMYLTKHYMLESEDAISFIVDEINITNMLVENMNGFSGSGFFSLQSDNAKITNLTARNMSSFRFDTDYDAKTGRYVYSAYYNSGVFMDIMGKNVTFSNSTFSDLTFSSQDEYNPHSAIIIASYSDIENLIFDNCNFINCLSAPYNYTQYNSATGEYESQIGNYNYGIISCYSVLNCLINECEFVNCSSDHGGVVYFDTYGVSNSTTVSNSKFINCSAIQGGAVYMTSLENYMRSPGRLFIINSTFENNSAVEGGAVYITGYSDPWRTIYSGNLTIVDSRFVNNSAKNGGAICISNLTCNNTITNCNFTANTAEYDGGAVYLMANDMGLNLINSSVFIANHANHNGGAFYFNDTFNEYVFVDYRWFYRTVMFSDNVELRQYNTQILNTGFENNTDYTLKIIAGGQKPSDNQTVTVEIAPDATGVVEVNITDNDGRILTDINGIPIEGNFTLVNGSVSFNLGKMPLGSYRVSARYDNYSYYDTNLYLFHINATSFNVTQNDLKADVSIANVTVIDNVTVRVNVSDDFRGNVSIVIDNVTLYDGPVNSTIDIGGLSSGNKTANVTFYGDENYANKSVECNFTVFKIDLNAGVVIDNVTAVENVTVDIINVPDNFNGNVSIVVDNVTVYDGPVNSTIDIGRFSSGNKTSIVTFYGDENYNNESVRVNFTVSKLDLDANVTAGDVAFNEDVMFDIEVPENYTGNVSIVVDGKTLYNGSANASINVGAMGIGDKTAEVIFYGDDTYADKSVNVKFAVKSAISAEDMVRGWNSPYDYKAGFLDKGLKPLGNTDVTFTVNGVKYVARTDSNGFAYLTTSKLPVGKYSVTVTNPVNGESVTRTLTIVERLVENRDITMEFVDGTYYTVRAIGDDGKPVGAGEHVFITVNGVTYNRITDANGYAYLKINLNPKTYTITAEYKNYEVSNTLKVKQTLKLVKKNVKIKKTAKKIILKAKLKWANGKPIKGKKIIFKFRGKSYKAKTNKKGIAKVTVKKKVIKKLKKGKKYTFSAKYIKNYVKGKVIVKK